MKNKKNEGFTLIELLAVIVIIGVVALIAVPTVVSNIEESREKLYATQVQNIELSAKKWATEYREELDSEYLNSTYVSVKMLRDLGFVSKDKLQNPITGEEMLGCVTISYDSSDKTYKYEYVDENTNCETVASGYFYKYSEEDGTWHKDLSKQRESIYSYLVGEGAKNIVASGNGLYDMEDRYVFRGDVDNYVKLNGADYRIISLDKNTKSLKLISLDPNGSGAWENTTNISFNTTTLYGTINDETTKKLYSGITNKNVKWNIGKITNTDGLNLNAVKAYESSAQIESEIALISMSEYMEASLNEACSSGNLASCANETYLNIPDSWTMTTTESTVVYVDGSKGLSYEDDLTNNQHYIYRVVNIVNMEKNENGKGTMSDPFIITSPKS